MAKRIKRVTIYRTDDPRLAGRKAILEASRKRDLISVSKRGVVSVYPGATAEELSPKEREVLYLLLGYLQPDPDKPLIIKRAGLVGGRAVIAGTRIPVWRVAAALREGATIADIRRATGLSDAQIEQARVYAEEHRDEIEMDILDNELAARAGAGAWM